MRYADAEAEIRDLLANPFGPPRGHFWNVAYYLPTQPRRRPWVPAGAQAAYLRAAAVRTLTQGEG
jgi:hypothetical protein